MLSFFVKEEGLIIALALPVYVISFVGDFSCQYLTAHFICFSLLFFDRKKFQKHPYGFMTLIL